MPLTKLDKASRIAIKDCMGAKKKEKILVVTDENKREIGQSLYINALELGHEAFLLEMKSREYNGEEPPKFVADAMKMADVIDMIAKLRKHVMPFCRQGKLTVMMPQAPKLTVLARVRMGSCIRGWRGATRTMGTGRSWTTPRGLCGRGCAMMM